MTYKKKINRFLKLMVDRGASDFHFTVGRPPLFRRSGAIEPVRYRIIRDTDWREVVKPIVRDELWQQFCASGDIDFAYEIANVARFRVNLFKQERGNGAVFRMIPSSIMSIEQLGLPDRVRQFAEYPSGLVLVTGPTGSGKSTSLAAIIHLLNSHKDCHIITLEDPIEFVHAPIKALIHQRELGVHMNSFVDGIKSATREDPDVILVGEMRDMETMRLALESAEKGLLVFATLHTNSAAKSIDRIINVFPAEEQAGIRSILGESLQGILAQQLLPRVEGGRVAAVELLFATPALANIIREGKTHQLISFLQTGRSLGMITMDESIMQLYKNKVISAQAAFDKAIDKELFAQLLETPDNTN